MQSSQTKFIDFSEVRISSLRNSLKTLTTHMKPRRLIREDPGVKADLWFGSKPQSRLHVFANILRLFCGVVLAPVYMWLPYVDKSQVKRLLFGRFTWGVEWSQVPDAVLVEESYLAGGNTVKIGEYAVIGRKPRWLLDVEFRDGAVVSIEQVQYDFRDEWGALPDPTSAAGLEMNRSRDLRWHVQQAGYTAISYSMESAENIFFGSGQTIDPQPEIRPNNDRKYNNHNRKKISQALLDEYAAARKTMQGNSDGREFIWLDEFCLSSDKSQDQREVSLHRSHELGQLADIFRGARKVVVFCHKIGCDHTEMDCPWANRLFTLGEILYAPEVLRMSRTREPSEEEKHPSSITVVPGHHFRADMQARAAEAKMWHLYNIMQHATNSGAVTWQSAIHSLVVEVIRRDQASGFQNHKFLGKALNGLLPRRSQLSDLGGVNGWEDLAWLLELNQGYYNAAMLAAVCKLASPEVKEYRWWGEPIAPKEGCERLEPLATAIPIRFCNTKTGTTEPALSIIGPQSIKLENMLRRDARGLYQHPEMESLSLWMIVVWVILTIVGLASASASPTAGIVIIWVTSTFYVTVELLAGTIYVQKDMWVALVDHEVPGGDGYKYLQSQDPTFLKAPQWGKRQLVPNWGSSDSEGASTPTKPFQPYPLTLVDLRTGLRTKAMVTSLPNDMVVLAVHGYGITCMLLDRDTDTQDATMAVKVGMANLPPYILSQTEKSGTVYVGGAPSRERVPQSSTKRTAVQLLGPEEANLPSWDRSLDQKIQNSGHRVQPPTSRYTRPPMQIHAGSSTSLLLPMSSSTHSLVAPGTRSGALGRLDSQRNWEVPPSNSGAAPSSVLGATERNNSRRSWMVDTNGAV